jgi:hypothetical protein
MGSHIDIRGERGAAPGVERGSYAAWRPSHPNHAKILWVFVTFGEGCPKALMIQTVMQLGHFLAIAPITFFNSMR